MMVVNVVVGRNRCRSLERIVDAEHCVLKAMFPQPVSLVRTEEGATKGSAEIRIVDVRPSPLQTPAGAPEYPRRVRSL